MRLFHNRPFAFLCFAFIFVAFCLSYVSWEIKVIFAAILFLAAFSIGGALVLRKALKKEKTKAYYKTFFVLLVAISAMLAPLSHLTFVDLRREAALEFVGERYVSFVVISEKYDGEYSSEYLVKTESIDKQGEAYKCLVICAFPDAFEVGDKIYAKAELYPSGEELLGYNRYASDGEYLQGVIQNDTDYAVISKGNNNLSIAIRSIRNAFSEYLERIFGTEDAGLAEGFLLGDKSDLSPIALRDFKRSGTSHLLAVSGLHMSVVIGSLGFLLTKLGLKRGIRSVVLSILALVFLALTGFSMSACRAVVMLWIVYMSYLYVKENDPVTSLFFAVALIIFFVPSSIYDVGLWLSFLATLGVVSVWQPLSNKLSSGNRKGFLGKTKYLLKKLLLAILITFICNAFICIVIWSCFGEISVVSLLSNLVLSPMSSVYIILVLLCCVCGFFTPLVLFTAHFGEIMITIAGCFSRISGAVISLTYDFAPPIIIFMTAAIAIMLVVRLRKKWLILLPPLVAAAAFFVCFSIYTVNIGRQTTVNYYSESKNEMLIFTRGYSASICDISDGSYAFMKNAQSVMASEHATEISDVMLTHYHARHPSSLDKIFRNLLVRRISIPCPENTDELYLAKLIADLCEKYVVELSVYDNGERLDIGNCDFVVPVRETITNVDEHPSICVVFCNGGEVMTYVSPESHLGAIADVAQGVVSGSDKVIFGLHGNTSESFYSYELGEQIECVFYSNSLLFELSDIEAGEYTVCVCDDSIKIRKFKLLLG